MIDDDFLDLIDQAFLEDQIDGGGYGAGLLIATIRE